MVGRLILRVLGLAREAEAEAAAENPAGAHASTSAFASEGWLQEDELPEDLAIAIAQATIASRPSDDDRPGDDRILIRMTGLGLWYWDGVDEAADRVSRAYPWINRRACIKAARLIGGEVGRRNREMVRGRRRNWVLDWDDPPARGWWR